MLADELATSLRSRGRAVIRASVEGFLRPRIERYRRGPESAQGCYEDSFDYDRLRVELLRPLGESGSRLYRTEIYDRRTDLLVDYEQLEASTDAILLFDGVFLLRPKLVDVWDFRVFITVASEEIIRRARIRDAEVCLPGSPDDAERRFRARYLPSQRHYRGTGPAGRARRRRARERRPLPACRARAELKRLLYAGTICDMGRRGHGERRQGTTEGGQRPPS